MKKTILTSYIALFVAFLLPFSAKWKEKSTEAPAETLPPEENRSAEPVSIEPAPESIRVLVGEEVMEMDMQSYLSGVVAAEMPASFPEEALKAQAVAARTYAMYCADGGKHKEAQVCTDFACCQAWLDETALRENWGEGYDTYAQKIRTAVENTAGQYLSYEGQAVFAAFHSSSAGATADCGQVWNPRPYLLSVSSPETEADVPNFVSRAEFAAIDFRDTILYACPEADFTGEESTWIQEINRDDSGRVLSCVLGGVEIKGTKLRSLFKLRSTAFELSYSEGRFLFIVTGNGHGVGMSQYGAKVMAEKGSDYAAILAHYYPGTVLSR